MTAEGWVAIVTLVLAVATFLLFWQTRKTAGLAGKTAGLAEQDMALRVIPFVTPNDVLMRPDQWTVKLRNDGGGIAINARARLVLEGQSTGSPSRSQRIPLEATSVQSLGPGEEAEIELQGPAWMPDDLSKVEIATEFSDLVGRRYKLDQKASPQSEVGFSRRDGDRWISIWEEAAEVKTSE